MVSAIPWTQDLLIRTALPWAPRIAAIVQRIAGHVQFEPDHIMMFSDYSGQHRSSLFETYSFLLIDETSTSELPSSLSQWRATNGMGERRISFKQLGDKTRARSLPSYLEAFDNVPGACITVAVAKDVGNLVTGHSSPTTWRSAHLGSFPLSSSTLEKTARICNFASIILTALLVGSFRDLTWITDEDDIIANPHVHDGLLEMFARLFSYYDRRPHRTLAVSTPTYDPTTRLAIEDMLSITDLTAGAACEFLNNSTQAEVDGLMITTSQSSPKTELIVNWIRAYGGRMHRGIIVIDRIKSAKRIRFLNPVTI